MGTRTIKMTIMGVVIGVASVLSMVTLGQYTKKRVLESYATMGVNSMRFDAYPSWTYRAVDQAPSVFSSLKWDRDVEPLKRMFPEVRRISPQYNAYGMSAVYGGRAVENEASGRITEKQGMRRIGQAEKDYVSGRLLSDIWEITAEEWRARKP